MRLDQPFKSICHIDVTPLQRKLAGTPPDFWDRWTFRQDRTESQKDTQSIILCWSGFASAKDEKFRSDAFETEKWLPEAGFWSPELDPIMETVRRHYPGGVLRALLARLKPDGYICPHRDQDPTFDRSHRLHLPIVGDGTQFVIDGAMYMYDEGELFEFDNLLEHSVLNNGVLARTHLIMDVLDTG